MPDYVRRFSPDPAPAPKFQKRRSPSIPRQRSREPQALRKTKDQIMEESVILVLAKFLGCFSHGIRIIIIL